MPNTVTFTVHKFANCYIILMYVIVIRVCTVHVHNVKMYSTYIDVPGSTCGATPLGYGIRLITNLITSPYPSSLVLPIPRCCRTVIATAPRRLSKPIRERRTSTTEAEKLTCTCKYTWREHRILRLGRKGVCVYGTEGCKHGMSEYRCWSYIAKGEEKRTAISILRLNRLVLPIKI